MGMEGPTMSQETQSPLLGLKAFLPLLTKGHSTKATRHCLECMWEVLLFSLWEDLPSLIPVIIGSPSLRKSCG